MLSRGLEYFPEGWYGLYRVGIPLYTVDMLSIGLECFLEGWNAFWRVGMLSTRLEYLCTLL
jgi:hypothetical protein